MYCTMESVLTNTLYNYIDYYAAQVLHLNVILLSLISHTSLSCTSGCQLDFAAEPPAVPRAMNGKWYLFTLCDFVRRKVSLRPSLSGPQF